MPHLSSAATTQVEARATCGFPAQGPHAERSPRQRPLYTAFKEDPTQGPLVAQLLAQYSTAVAQRAQRLCRAWTVNGFVPSGWNASLPASLAALSPGSVLAGRLADAEAGAATAPMPAPTPLPVAFVTLPQPANTKHAPPYDPVPGWVRFFMRRFRVAVSH